MIFQANNSALKLINIAVQIFRFEVENQFQVMNFKYLLAKKGNKAPKNYS